MTRLVVVLLLLSAVDAAAQGEARDRLLRDSQPAGANWWENARSQDLTADEVLCNLPKADVYTAPGFRVADPVNTGRECQWTAPPGAEIFLTMLANRTHTFTLRTRPDPWTPWSDVAEFTVGQAPTWTPKTPANLRIIVPSQ